MLASSPSKLKWQIRVSLELFKPCFAGKIVISNQIIRDCLMFS